MCGACGQKYRGPTRTRSAVVYKRDKRGKAVVVSTPPPAPESSPSTTATTSDAENQNSKATE